jgi:hypothetical protein
LKLIFIVLDLYFRRLFIQKINKTHFEAKHTKDSKEFACSTLTLCHLSRAILSMNLRWVRGPTLTRAKVEFSSKKIKKNRFFFQEKFPSILGTGCPKIGHRVPKNWAPEIWAPDRPPPQITGNFVLIKSTYWYIQA